MAHTISHRHLLFQANLPPFVDPATLRPARWKRHVTIAASTAAVSIEGCMSGSIRLFLITVAVMMVSALSARAADSGSLSGFVYDQNGQPVADATVQLSGK